MRHFFKIIQDASIYEEHRSRNAGHDEILEVGKSSSGTKSVRSLLQVDVNSISQSISTGEIPSGSVFELKLFVARADDLRIGQVVELNAISRSWSEGSGYYYQNVNVPYTASREVTSGYTETDGVTWVNRQSGSLWSVTGSEFFASPTISGTISNPVEDMTFDISTMVRSWISGSISNNGLVLKFPTDDEIDDLNAGNIRFFSRQTHTIYIPTLTAKYNDQLYISGALSGSDAAQVLVAPNNLQLKYRQNEFVRVDLSVRNRYPLKTFNTVFTNYLGNQRLPQTAYFSIVDVQSNTTIIPFDEYSLVNCDGTGSYVDFHIQGMYPGRYYKMLVKVVDSRYTKIFDTGHHFTVEQI